MKVCKNWIPKIMELLDIKEEDSIYLFYDNGANEANPYRFRNGIFIDCDGVNSEDYLSDILLGNCEYEVIKPLLTSKEKTYLENMTKPFNDRDITIMKRNRLGEEWIEITIEYHWFTLPSFEENEHYMKLDIGKKYTLEELGLFNEVN